MRQAAEVLAFAAEDWKELNGKPFPRPRTVDEFAEVNGVGASKLKDFAARFLGAIRAHEDNGREAAAAKRRA